MSTESKRLIAALAGYPALWLFSALLHMVDANLNGLEGFLPLVTTPSVYGLAAFLFIPCLIAVMGFGLRGIKAYWTILVGTAVLISGLLTISGSTATDFIGYAISFSGMMIICTLFMVPGTLPGVLFLRMSRDRA